MANATLLAERFGGDVTQRYRAPSLGDGLVSRQRLFARLLDPSGPPLALVTAPAGYGRTTLLADWAGRDPRGVAWIALDKSHDDDPALLAAAVSEALDRPTPFALVLDDVQVLRSEGACNVLRALADHVPAGSRVVLSSRTEPPLPIGRLRAQRSLLELEASDLAMTAAEAAELLHHEGLRPAPGEAETLVRRTEGWPVALYLAALSLREQRDPSRAQRFGGEDAVMRRYLADSVLPELPRRSLRFLEQTSVLERLSGGLCDAVLDTEGSGRLLAELATHRRLLVPLDRSGEWYRCPAVLREMLASELRREDPARERALRLRAADWFVAHDDSASAIDQAIAAGALERAGELLWTHAPGLVATGRRDAVERWLAALTSTDVGGDPHLALVSACAAFAGGDLGRVQRWEAVARRQLPEAQDRIGDEIVAAAGTMRAAVSADGLAGVARETACAQHAMPEASTWHSLCCFLEGAALHLTGDLDRAEAVLEDGARRGAVIAPGPRTLCLAQLALIAGDREEWEGGAALVARARTQVEHYGLRDYPTSALVFAASAAIRVRRGPVDEAQHDLRHAMRLVDAIVDFAPWYLAEVRAALAHAAIKLSDVTTARELLEAARRDARRVPESPVLAGWIARAEESSDAASAVALASSAALTTAELRILRFLPTHLSFREIGDDLYISTNTVKTQAHAVYRKLDASSRSQAVARAAKLGLLDA